MTLSGTRYFFQSGHIHSESQTKTAEHGYVVFTDAVSPRDDIAPNTGSQAAAALAEQAFHDFFTREAGTTVDQDFLQRAFAYVNQRVLELFGSDDDEVAVSAILIVEGKTLQVAGVGDAILYAIRPGQSNPLFVDPQTPRVDGLMSAEERHLSLHNAIGTGEEVQVHYLTHSPGTFERYVASSYGMIAQATEETIREVGAVPEEAVVSILERCSLTASTPHTLALTMAAREEGMEKLVADEKDALTQVTSQSRRSRERKLALALSGATCSLVLFVIFQMIGGQPTPQPEVLASVVEEGDSTDNASWVMALKEQVAMKEKKLQRLTEELQMARMDDRPNSGPGVQDLMQEMAEKTRENRQLSQHTADLSKKLKQREASVDDLELTVQALEERLSASPGKKGSPRDLGQVRKLEREVTRLTATLAEKDDILQSTRATNRDYAERYRKLEGQLTSKLDELSQSYERDQDKQIAMRHELAERVRELTTQLNEQMGRNRAVVAQLHQTKQNDTSSQSDAELASVESKLQQEQKRNRILKEELREALTKGADSATKEALASEQEVTRALKEELNGALAQVDRVSQELAAKQTNRQSDFTDYKERIDTLLAAQSRLEEENELLNEKIRSQTTAEAETSEMLNTLAQGEQKLDKLKNERNGLLDEKASLMDKIVAMEQFQELYQGEKAKREVKEAEFAAFRRQIEEQKSMLATIENSRTAMASELYKIRREYDALLKQRRTSQTATAQRQTPSRPAITSPASPSRQVARQVSNEGTRIHIVSRGETLSGIAMRYYGAAKYWTDIYNANQESVADTKNVAVGTPLVIPQLLEAKRG